MILRLMRNEESTFVRLFICISAPLILLILNSSLSVAIIGGGPAGLLAAQQLAERGWKVQLFEAQATVGRKFLVAGHGGFNLSNAEGSVHFAGRYGTESARFGTLLEHFSAADLRA